MTKREYDRLLKFCETHKGKHFTGHIYFYPEYGKKFTTKEPGGYSIKIESLENPLQGHPFKKVQAVGMTIWDHRVGTVYQSSIHF